MEVIPAIDLKGGRCVRLYQGDFDKETVFSDDPVAVALSFQAQGALRLHIIDLDGAAQGEPVHTSVIEAVAKALSIPIQVGGGIRRLESVERLLGLGVERAILGTVAVEDPALVKEACRRFGPGIVVAVDSTAGYVATHAWREMSQFTALQLMEKMADLGVGRFLYTDISRDGTLTEPNFAMIIELVTRLRVPIIASGGVSKLDHIKRLREIGVEATVVGRALYTGDINLREALKEAEETTVSGERP